jgi:hypothetical protein
MAPFFFIACEKSTGEIGLGQVIDSKAVLGTKRNLPVVAYTTTFDSILSTGPSQEIVGAYIDPVFGGVDARFNTHILLSLLSPDFGDDPICDSVVLLLGYNGYYADTSQPVTFVVNELGEYLDPDSTYYSNKEFALGQELGRVTTIPRPRTLSFDEGDVIAPALRIDLDKQYFQENLINASRLAQGYFINNVEFIKHVYGMQVRAEGYASGLTYFNISSLSSLIKVYYRESSADTVSLRYELYYGVFTNDNFVSVNTFRQDFSLAEFNIDNQDTANGEETLYTQAMSGAITHVNLPDLKSYRDSGFIINRAELIMPVRKGSAGKYFLPSTLLLLEDQGEDKPLIDDYDPIGLVTGGRLEVGRLRDQKYTFNITRLVHRYITTNDSIYPLAVVPGASASRGWRAVLNGYLDPVEPMEFNIYYTKAAE